MISSSVRRLRFIAELSLHLVYGGQAAFLPD